MTAPFGAYSVHSFNDQELVSEVGPISIDGARHVAQTNSLLGQSVRVMCEDADYCEVYSGGVMVRRGTFGQTTLVRGSAS